MVYGILPLAFDILLGISSYSCRTVLQNCFVGRQEGQSICVCVSPLTSVMIDQRRNFSSFGISVELVGEAQTDKEVIKKVVAGSFPLVLISPENITSNSLYRNMLMNKAYKERLVALVIDEAHVIKDW